MLFVADDVVNNTVEGTTDDGDGEGVKSGPFDGVSLVVDLVDDVAGGGFL